MPGDHQTTKVLDFDEQDNFTPQKGEGSPKAGTASPKQEQSRTASKEAGRA